MVLVVNCLIVVLCFAGAVGLLIGKSAGEKARKVAINLPPNNPQRCRRPTARSDRRAGSDTADRHRHRPTPSPKPTQRRMNFLVTGADNSTDKSCVDLQDKGPRTGERSDTIMVIRLDPATKRSAVLSFPRDLWVKIPGHGTQRINGAYRHDDPQLLIDTIQTGIRRRDRSLHPDRLLRVPTPRDGSRRRQRAVAIPRS